MASTSSVAMLSNTFCEQVLNLEKIKQTTYEKPSGI
jgi:hypothetical protein